MSSTAKRRGKAPTASPAPTPTASSRKSPVKTDPVNALLAVALLVALLGGLCVLGWYLYTPTQSPASAVTVAELLNLERSQPHSQQEQQSETPPASASPLSEPTQTILASTSSPFVVEHVQPRSSAEGFAMWDPVAVGHVRRLRLDGTSRVYEMKTMALDPPIFVIEDFLTEKECERVKELAVRAGLFKSDHTFLDGSNLNDRFKDTTKLSKDEANALFRYSEQTWLPPTKDALLQNLISRATRLAMLPPQASIESMQVVRYGVEGHYESHYDSEADDKGPCCIDPIAESMATGVEALGRPLTERCRLCRVMTILYYLEDTLEGGGTVFPLADLNETEFARWKSFPSYRQTRECHPGVVVAPKKRQAVMWYNHNLDRGYIGELNPRSLHGGCNVKNGVKWIANHWISVAPHPDVPRVAAKKHQ